MVQSEYQERVRIRQNALIYRQRISSLIDALKDGYRMTGCLTGNCLKTERRSVKQLERSRDALEKL